MLDSMEETMRLPISRLAKHVATKITSIALTQGKGMELATTRQDAYLPWLKYPPKVLGMAMMLAWVPTATTYYESKEGPCGGERVYLISLLAGGGQ